MSFTRYDTEDQVISSETVVRPMWDSNTTQLTTFYTSSTQTTSSLRFYLDIYGSNLPSSSLSFDIEFGNVVGSGSTYVNPDPSLVNYSTSRIIYGQYRNLIYETETSNILDSKGNLMGSGSIFAINLARSAFKESIKPGSLSLSLSGSSGTLTLTDNSSVLSTTQFIGDNIYYDLVSGSLGNVVTSANKYGYLFPNLGIIIIDPVLTQGYIAAVNTSSPTSTDPQNHKLLWSSLVLGANFSLQSQETVSTSYYFTRVKNSDYNYTTNPSIIDNNGNLLYNTLINNPQTYITTVGLYNDNNELLAVAKLSQPLTKDFTKEALLRLKLSY